MSWDHTTKCGGKVLALEQAGRKSFLQYDADAFTELPAIVIPQAPEMSIGDTDDAEWSDVSRGGFLQVLTDVIERWVADANMVTRCGDGPARKRVNRKSVAEMEQARELLRRASIEPHHYITVNRCALLLNRSPREILDGIAAQLFPLDTATGLPQWPAGMPQTTVGGTGGKKKACIHES